MKVLSSIRPLSVLVLCLLLLAGCGSSSSNGDGDTGGSNTGNGGTNGGGGTTAPSAPTVTSISPASVPVGSPAFTLTITGTGFASTSTVQVNGTAVTSSYVSATQLTAAVPASAAAAAGTLSIVVLNGTLGSTSSVSLAVDNPTPVVSSISPAVLPAGTSVSTTITVTGSNFVPTSVVEFNGSARTTTYVSSTQLTFQLAAADQATVQNAVVTVSNPPPGGGTSTTATLELVQPTPNPVITSVSPSQIYIGSANELEVQGSNLTSNSTVLWNGSPLATTFSVTTIGSTTSGILLASVPAAILSVPAAASVTVEDAFSLSASNAVTVNVVDPPVPAITSLSPGGAPMNTATTATMTGTGFAETSTVQIDGATVPSTYVSNTSMTVQISGTTLSLVGNHSFTVTTPAPGGGTSTAYPFTAYVGLPNNSMALNPVNGLLYVSVPGSAGPPYGNSVVPVDPATGALGTPIYVGSEPDKLAISSDGTTLWVGLDAASAVREVNLTNGTAGFQFSLNTGGYDYPPVVHAIAVLPGTTNSIVVASESNGFSLYEDLLTIYDSGVARANTIPLSTLQTLPALFVNPTAPEIYATSEQSGYQVLSYNANGLAYLAGNNGVDNSSAPYGTAVQVDAGNAYLDTGLVLTAESGTLEGTFYSSSTTVATGPMVSDSTLGRNFILMGVSNYIDDKPLALTIQAFNESTLKPIASGVISVYGAMAGTKYGADNDSATDLDGVNGVDTMLRWGSNGLAFRAPNGIFSLRSNVVEDLSTTSADLGVSVSAPASVAAGTNFTATATITNNGPSAATNAVASFTVPAGVSLVSDSTSVGSCGGSGSGAVTCSFGGVSSGQSIPVGLVFEAMTQGSAVVSANVSAGQNDPVSSNNTASAATAITGATVAPLPALASIFPNVAAAGSSGFTLTVNGIGFTENSTVEWGTTALATSYVSATQLTAEVPAGMLSNMGWAAVTVDTPSPGGGVSGALPFSIFTIVNLYANHMVYDPYTRLLYASVNSAATQVAGNTLVTIDPTTGALGTPVSVGTQPGKMALTGDGNYLYVNQGTNTVGRFNMTTQKLDFSFLVSGPDGNTATLSDIAALPGTDNTIAVDTGLFADTVLYDVNPMSQTAAMRVGASESDGATIGSSLQFLDASTLLSSSGALTESAVTANGFSYGANSTYNLNSFGSFKIDSGLAYADAGGVASVADASTPVQVGVFLTPVSNTGQVDLPGLIDTSESIYYDTDGQISEPDTSQGISFFAIPAAYANTGMVMLQSFNQQNFLRLGMMYASMVPEGRGAGGELTLLDMLRCGPDELALLRSDGTIMLFQGGFVVPGLLSQNPAAALTAISTLTHGSGNSIVTLTGTGFLPGVAVMWNGSYRTTTLGSSTEVTVDLPASDLLNAGTASVTAVNPGASPSNALTVSIN